VFSDCCDECWSGTQLEANKDNYSNPAANRAVSNIDLIGNEADQLFNW
jgi:hypothetical protein